MNRRLVNRRLAGAHEDVASLRRYLVGAGIMERDSGRYWLTSQETRPR